MNTKRMNRLEELGRVDNEKAYTKKGKRNLKDEKKRLVSEVKKDKKKMFKANQGRMLLIKKLKGSSGILVPGGFGFRGSEGKINGIN